MSQKLSIISDNSVLDRKLYIKLKISSNYSKYHYDKLDFMAQGGDIVHGNGTGGMSI